MYHFPKPPRPTFTSGEARFLEWTATLILAIMFALLLSGCATTGTSPMTEHMDWRCSDGLVIHDSYEEAREQCRAPMAAKEGPNGFNQMPIQDGRMALGVGRGAPVVIDGGEWTRTDAAVWTKGGYTFIKPNNDL
ncbi:hypothetical protein FGG69_gp43 [Salinibacter phage SRUTV-1]|uniref:Uncharacterized protein n=1 Tax=Salinibacter phage SRUTV-1 TaxID=2684227 RepID=A0A2D3FAJ4_9CAUD|nr:hypothetical protein FGG69_gp43 [Salinibacter phage SRUTV-1]ATU47029.1 hypothetical protein [Salinibacter phage SRUTV-1]AUO79372.1 hypothetical protein [Salinibacter virus M31CR41-3]